MMLNDVPEYTQSCTVYDCPLDCYIILMRMIGTLFQYIDDHMCTIGTVFQYVDDHMCMIEFT